MSNQQQSVKMWSGRFRAAPNPFFDSWQRSLPFDSRLLDDELAASRAHASALLAAHALTHEEHDRIVKALGNLGERYSTEIDSVRKDTQAEDIHHFVELRL